MAMANSPAQPQPPLEEEESFTCEICIEPVSSPTGTAIRKLTDNKNCIHPFCTDCMIKYIQVQLEDNVAKIKCPALDCRQYLDPLSCRPLIQRQLFEKWCDLLCDSTVLGMDRVYCPNRDCSALVVNECGGIVNKSVCPNCKKKFCFTCRVPWHAGFRCVDGDVRMMDPNDVAFGVLAEAMKWMRCPACRHFIERTRGCSIVHCRCQTYFCYDCGSLVHNGGCICRGLARRNGRVVHFIYLFLMMFAYFILIYFLPAFWLLMRHEKDSNP